MIIEIMMNRVQYRSGDLIIVGTTMQIIKPRKVDMIIDVV